jgi:hypothetical protein
MSVLGIRPALLLVGGGAASDREKQAATGFSG